MSNSWRPGQSASERTARAVQSMAPGSMEGRIASAAPTENRRSERDGTGETAEAIFSYPGGGPQAGVESPPYFNHNALADLATVIANTRSNTTGPTSIQVKVNGSAVVTVTLPSGNNQSVEVAADVVLNYGDQITVICSSVGSGLSGLVVQCLLDV